MTNDYTRIRLMALDELVFLKYLANYPFYLDSRDYILFALRTVFIYLPTSKLFQMAFTQNITSI